MHTSITEARIKSRSPLLVGAPSILFLLLHACTAYGQGGAAPSSRHAALEFDGDHALKLSVTGSWPAQQIVTRLRREYGWVVDMEQAPQDARFLMRMSDGKPHPAMRTVVVKIPRPADQSVAEEKIVLDGLAKGLSENGEAVEAVRNGSGVRYDLIPTGGGAPPLLSTTIRLPVKTRSVEDTVTDILEQVHLVTGQPIVQGGMLDSALMLTQVTVGGELPARTLLAQALDALLLADVWLLTFDPYEETYAFALDVAVKESTGPSGVTVETLIRAHGK